MPEFMNSLMLWIILLNVIVSLYALYVDRRVFDKGMLRPYRTFRNQTWYELVTSGFLHANLTHLMVNMFVLFIFGSVMESVLGPLHFLMLYFSGLLVSSIPSLVKHKENPEYATIGASGAVEAVLFSFIFFFPTEDLVLILLPIPIPAWLFGLAFLAYSIYEGKRGKGNVNHAAHIAGAVWGIVYLILFVPNSVERVLTVFGLV